MSAAEDFASATVSMARGLYTDLRNLFLAARGVRNVMRQLTRHDVGTADWKFAADVRRFFPTIGNLTSLVSLLETKRYATEDKCPHCGGDL